MEAIHITDKEVQDVQQLLLNKYGYDFTQYSFSSFRRRLSRFMEVSDTENTVQLKENLTTDTDCFYKLLQTVTINVTEMFRDPSFYKVLRESIIPALATYPIIKIWHAGCATGEEVFSLAIVLEEEGLLDRCRIYATDINPANIEQARKGVVSGKIKDFTHNYYEAGGKKDFASYYTARYNNIIINKSLRNKIVFAQHNLVTDAAFNEFQLILCRNVLIYFNETLKQKVIDLFCDSLSPLGYLAIGMKESLLQKQIEGRFDAVIPAHKIFKKK